MTTKRTPISCPKCGKHEKVAYVEIRRTKLWYFNTEIVETENTENMSAGNYLSTGPEAGTETIDSMGNEERLECFDCGARFDVPEVDDILVDSQ